MSKRQSIKQLSYGYTIDQCINVYDNECTVGYYKILSTGGVYCRSISGIEATFTGGNAVSLAKIFLATYKNHKKPKVTRQPKYQDNYKLNLI